MKIIFNPPSDAALKVLYLDVQRSAIRDYEASLKDKPKESA